MEIIVEGKAKENFIPNQIILKINFIIKDKSYKKILELGVNIVEEVINNAVIKNGFSKNSLKTTNFFIKEEKEYNNITNQFDFVGYSYNQYTVLKFDYDNELLLNIINDLNNLKTPISYQICFGIKDENECHKILLNKAYNDALEKAKIIASSANKKIIECIKVDYKKNHDEQIIESNIDTFSLARNSVVDVPNLLMPEDIEIKEKLYTIWIAE